MIGAMEDNGEGSSRHPPGDYYPAFGGLPPAFAYPLTYQHQYVPPTYASQDPFVYPGVYHHYTGRPFVLPVIRRPQPRARNGCFHSTMVRQFVGEYERCDQCGVKPYLGWLLLCTEDTAGYAASRNPDDPVLAPWISKAIINGHYTEEEREIVIQQKLEVIEMTEEMKQPPTPSLAEVDLTGVDVMYGVQQDDDDSDEQVWIEDISQQDQNLPTEQRPILHLAQPGPNPYIQFTPPPPPAPEPCAFRCCHRCEPAWHERAWICLDAYLKDETTETPLPWEFSNRRVSDVNIVRNLNNHYPLRQSFAAEPFYYTDALGGSGATQDAEFYLRRNTTNMDLPFLFSQSSLEVEESLEQFRALNIHGNEPEQGMNIGLASAGKPSAQKKVVSFAETDDFYDP